MIRTLIGAIAALTLLAPAAASAAPKLDSTFPRRALPIVPQRISQADNGSVLVLGHRAGTGTRESLVRLTSADHPSVDPTFGKHGVAELPDGVFVAPARTPDGGVVLAGYSGSAAGVAVVELTRTGALDPSFGTAGTTHFSAATRELASPPVAIATQPDGTIVITGVDGGPGGIGTAKDGNFVYLARLSKSGTLLSTKSFTPTVGCAANASTLTASASAIYVGYTVDQSCAYDAGDDGEGGYGAGILKLDGDGQPDTRFGTDGDQAIAFHDAEGAVALVDTLTLLKGGAIAVTAYDSLYGMATYIVDRRGAHGRLTYRSRTAPDIDLAAFARPNGGLTAFGWQDTKARAGDLAVTLIDPSGKARTTRLDVTLTDPVAPLLDSKGRVLLIDRLGDAGRIRRLG